MAGLIVPELSRKLELLIDHGHFNSRAAIARSLGRSSVTLRGWANGGSGAPPNTVTRPNAKAFVGLFAAALPDLSKDQIRQLVDGPADDLEAALSSDSNRSLKYLIDRHADWNACTLHLARSEFGLVRVVREEKVAQYRIALAKPFRLEFSTRSRAGFVVALQSAPGGWGVVPSYLDRRRKCVDLPGGNLNQEFGLITEENEIGNHVFVAAQASRPFPAAFKSAADDGISLDRTLLSHFLRHFEDQDKSTRRLFAVSIEFFDPTKD